MANFHACCQGYLKVNQMMVEALQSPQGVHTFFPTEIWDPLQTSRYFEGICGGSNGFTKLLVFCKAPEFFRHINTPVHISRFLQMWDGLLWKAPKGIKGFTQSWALCTEDSSSPGHAPHTVWEVGPVHHSLLGTAWKVKIYTQNSSPTHHPGDGDNLLTLFLCIAWFIKVCWKNSSLPNIPSPHGKEPIHQTFCRQWHEMSRHAGKSHLCQPPSLCQVGGSGQFTLFFPFFAGNCMKCLDLHRKFYLPTLTPYTERTLQSPYTEWTSQIPIQWRLWDTGIPVYVNFAKSFYLGQEICCMRHYSSFWNLLILKKFTYLQRNPPLPLQKKRDQKLKVYQDEI